MKRVKFILPAVLLLMCLNCGKDTPKDQAVETKKKVESTNSKIILQINDKEFSNKDFEDFVHVKYPDFSKAGSASQSEIELTPKLLSRLFDSFVEQKIISFIADQRNIPVDETEIADYLKELKIADSDPVDKAQVIESIKVQKYLYFKVYDGIEVTNKEISNYYNAHRDEFRSNPQVLLYQILVTDKETAVKIRGELDDNPRRFEEIAKEKSVSMEASKGGLMGYFEKGVLPLDMENVVFSLKPYSISPVFESSYGFHIFKVTKKKKGQREYLQNVKPEIKNKLLSEKMSNAYREFLAKARQELSIAIKYDNLYFNYQRIYKDLTIEGDNSDETKETSDSNNTDTDNSIN